ncbi:hypothetical protein AMTR_s02647p00008760, partial [Amborella trichopoda]
MHICCSYREGTLAERVRSYCQKLRRERRGPMGFLWSLQRGEGANESEGSLAEQRREEGKRERVEAYRAEKSKREEG